MKTFLALSFMVLALSAFSQDRKEELSAQFNQYFAETLSVVEGEQIVLSNPIDQAERCHVLIDRTKKDIIRINFIMSDRSTEFEINKANEDDLTYAIFMMPTFAQVNHSDTVNLSTFQLRTVNEHLVRFTLITKQDNISTQLNCPVEIPSAQPKSQNDHQMDKVYNDLKEAFKNNPDVKVTKE